MRRAFSTLVLALPLLAACQLALPGRSGPEVTAGSVTGGTITTTTLDNAPAVAPAGAEPALADAAAPASDGAAPADPVAEATAAPEQAAAPDPAVSPTAPVEVKSAAQIACENDDGIWARAGSGGGMACVRQTRDGGKQCDSKTDCQGECLARSRTCAPIRPLFGCNAVLMDNGAEVNLCID